MNLTRLLDKMSAVARRDLLTAILYRDGLSDYHRRRVGGIGRFSLSFASVGPGFRPNGVECFPFLIVGTGFYTFLVMGINSFLHFVQERSKLERWRS